MSAARRHWKPLLAAAVWLVLVPLPLRVLLEGDMVLHMTVQVPILIAIGVLLAPSVRPHEPRWLVEADWLGIPGLLLVIFATSFWMLPRSLDRALADPRMEFIKFLSLPLLVGLPLGLSWQRLPPLGRAFVFANFLSKLGAVGALFLAAPIRLCAYYRLDQQAVAGETLIAIAAGLTILWFAAAFFGWRWPARTATSRDRFTASRPPYVNTR
jgi:hypothetical protein